MAVRYTKGLHEVGDEVWAYLQPDGGWGWSNAGLITGGGASLLVDTLFDLKLTSEMLESMRHATPAAGRIGTVVNTHANGDHCYGNALVAGAEIVASKNCADEMMELPPSFSPSTPARTAGALLLKSSNRLSLTGSNWCHPHAPSKASWS